MMEYFTVQQTATKWGVSDRMVRYYCTSGLVPGARQEGKSWMVPASATKPNLNASAKEKVELPPLAGKLKNQQKKRNYHGLYDYTILNLTYSSCRMASSRLTRAQVENIIKKGKAQATFEPIKISDLIETRNHVECVNLILLAPMEPLTTKYIKDLHRKLFAGTVDEQRDLVVAGIFRRPKAKIKGRSIPPAKDISGRLEGLIRGYEEKEKIDLQDILDFHVQFERIVPFDDGNGRVGRLILFKECLRHDVMPFIIDDKRRGRYLEGLREWDESEDTLLEVVLGNLDGIGWINLLIVGLIHTGVTYCMYFSSLKELPGQKAAILSYIDPLVAVLISVTILGETMTLWQVIGGMLILGFTLWNEIAPKAKS